MKVAAIDIGTVTCRLLVVDIQDGIMHELHRCCAITNLGVGVDKTGVLQPDAIDRVVNQIAEYKAIIDAEPGEIAIMAIATSASRDAKNSNELVSRLNALGVTLSVVPGTTEAALSFKGASCAFGGEDLLVVDIGGGSTEVIFGQGGANPAFSHSFNIGCRRVTERFLFSDPPAAEELSAAAQWIEAEMTPIFAQAKAQQCVVNRVVAVAGTATSVVSIDKNMVVYDSAQVDKTVVPFETLDRIYRQLASLPVNQRAQVVGLEPQRAPVIVAGMLILEIVLKLAAQHEFTVSESDILQGMAMEIYAQA